MRKGIITDLMKSDLNCLIMVWVMNMAKQVDVMMNGLLIIFAHTVNLCKRDFWMSRKLLLC